MRLHRNTSLTEIKPCDKIAKEQKATPTRRRKGRKGNLKKNFAGSDGNDDRRP